MSPADALSAEERDRYSWQLDVRGFGDEGQRRLKGASVLVSRVGGVGGSAVMPLVAAGIGRIVLAHAGDLRRNDLNRQLLMSIEGLGRPRVESAERWIRAYNPNVEIELVAENVTAANVAGLVARCDVVVAAAPLFTERLLLNGEAVRQRKPLVDCAMYELEGRLTTVVPGGSPCLACLYPETPPNWRREFPVMGAVSSTVGSLAAMEAIKLIAGIGEPLCGRLLVLDLAAMNFRTIPLSRDPSCAVCAECEQPGMPSRAT